MVAGVPAGTLFSHVTQWRGDFWAVVALTVAGIIGCLLGLPAAETDRRTAPSVSRELATMRKPVLWGIYAITILTTAAYMITFNYLAAILADIPEVWIPAILTATARHGDLPAARRSGRSGRWWRAGGR
jgi:DHA1 family chloramphenicol resistance protein-like MFS transporter